MILVNKDDDMEISQDTIGNKWTVAHGYWHDKKPIIMRVRDLMEAMVGHPDYKNRYTLTWKFRKRDKNGFPSKDDSIAMEQFEEELIQALENGLHSIMVAVVTHGGKRDWIFYTTDIIEAQERLNNTFKYKPRYPIEINTYNDPEWKEYKGIKVNIKGFE